MAIPPQVPRWAASQRDMGPESVVLLLPPFDDHLGLSKSIENLPVEHLISQFSIERFVVSVLPGAVWLNEQGLDSDPPQNHSTLQSEDFAVYLSKSLVLR